MKHTISRDKAFKDLERILFIVFAILAGWFASSVLQQFFSSKTNFTQREEKITEYPAVTIVFPFQASKVNLTNLEIFYAVRGMAASNDTSNDASEDSSDDANEDANNDASKGTSSKDASHDTSEDASKDYSKDASEDTSDDARDDTSKDARKLKIGKNYFHNYEFNKTEEFILESFRNEEGFRVFRIIHSTPIRMDKKGIPPEVEIILHTKFKMSKNSDSEVAFYLTSPDNSQGFFSGEWNDGKPFQISMIKNSVVKCNIQAQITNYLKQTDKCQKEAFYNCLATQLDAIEFNEWSNTNLAKIGI